MRSNWGMLPRWNPKRQPERRMQVYRNRPDGSTWYFVCNVGKCDQFWLGSQKQMCNLADAH
jgi:hypothetical protein